MNSNPSTPPPKSPAKIPGAPLKKPFVSIRIAPPLEIELSKEEINIQLKALRE